ncbi:hypothetical protein BBO99_00005857 [Phytophthora kernoviae]|uniref:FYVE-type domain-containing protein n=2 Tax=Phytophthora kernoviae TaxID=325452 RepID=A0A3R7HVM2_9STRA|nr:hypothetical protein G195_009611 [Phytophthora kernoviae 00238/432]KAG2521681.1 hypothetical protein JM16_006104 [Phytophthora kernoviae]KAG2523088.1 hypothetical protein JM18_005893 [Phytophthora kernoviae]RLN31428.1 hypothetical protein BBI17_006375 [Phytophthora kernoviae]RLN78602.1 hypothetical protein BBO99_00005857 [Phytophthora kernoviae]
MKFPLPKNIFPPLELTENQELNYEQLANALIKATLAEYDQFVMHDRKRVDARRWKPVRTRDEIAIYRERLVDGVRKPSTANLALYQSAISTTSSRPSHQRQPGSESSDPAAYHTTSFNGAHSFGPPTTPKKKKLSSLDLDPTENSRDTTGDDSYSSNGLPMEPRITTAAFSSTDDHSEGLPRMLAVGNLRGSLDDVMYGVVSPNASSVRLRSSYLGEYIADCSVLREMKRPSPADPFRFLGIKWFVRAKHRGAARIVLPRDFVVLEFSGVMMRPDNSRVGFHLMHSVQIPTCRELHEHRILRAKVSSCYIFEETRTNRVQVFMTASVDPSGHVIPRMALRSAATALSNCWKSVACAHNKKLAYCLQNERPSTFGSSVATSSRGGHALGASVIRSSRGGLSALTPVNESAVRESSARLEPVSQRSNYNTTTNRRQCGVCRGKLGMLSKTTLCQLCCEQMCNRCRVVRKLSSDTLNSQVTQSAMNFCKKCVASVSDESALEIARQELWNTRARGRTRASSAVSRASSRHSFSSERNTYMTVVLGRGSEMNSRGSTATSSLGYSRGPSSFSAGREPSSLSASRGPNQEENGLGYSVGPRPSTSTDSSTPQQRPSSGRVSKPFSFNMSAGPLSSNTLSTDVLSLADLGMEDTSPPKAAAVKKTKTEEPVVLDHRLTMTIRSLRHLDYVLSVGESDLVDELDNEYQSEGEEDFVDVETEDEEEGRSSYASSVAVMDEGYESCDTPTSDMTIISQREAPIVEGDEPEEEEVETLQKNQEVIKTESEQQTEQQAASDKSEKPKESHETEKVAEQVEEQSKPQEVRKEPEQEDKKTDESQQVEAETEPAAKEKEEKKAESTREHGDAEVHEAVAVAEEIEVVEAAPIAEVHAMMLSDYETQKAKPHDDMEEAKPRLHRAHTTVPSSGENYQHQLFQQMQDLHSVAETTYQVARANTEAAFKERDSGRVSKTSPTADSQRGVRTFSQPFAFNVVGLRSTRAMTVGIRCKVSMILETDVQG